MIAEAFIARDGCVLMVKERVDRGDIVWSFPGGSVNEDETPEQACARETQEETGYEIRVTRLLREEDGRYTYLAEITGGELCLEEGIMESAWVSLNDGDKFDAVTAPVLSAYLTHTRSPYQP